MYTFTQATTMTHLLMIDEQHNVGCGVDVF